jgi:hypothetical protein
MTALTAGSYTVTVAGASGSLSHSLTVSLSAVDFTISLNPKSIGPFDPGASATTSVIVSSLNGFSGTVALSFSAPSALSVRLSPSAVNGGTGSSILMVTGSEPGTYNVTILGSSGTLVHALVVKVTVSTPPSGVFGLTTPEFYGSLGALIVVVLAVAFLVLRARTRRNR